MKETSYWKGAFLLTAGGLLAKGMGAVYRVLLTNALGGYGMGLYQMAYPLFCLILTFCSTGVPAALARMIAIDHVRGGAEETRRAAVRLFFVLGSMGSILMCAAAPLFSSLQRESLSVCYFALSPSVLFVALLSVLRGYFQGKGDMAPTAVSEILEVAVKSLTGLFFAQLFKDPMHRAAGALLGVSLSEAAALVLLALHRREPRVHALFAIKRSEGEIFLRAFPVMAAAAVLPLSNTLDSVILVRLMRRYAEDAVTRYGLFAGAATSLIGLASTACYGLAAAAVPHISSAERGEARSRAVTALGATLLLSLPCAAGLFLFAEKIVSLLFPALSAEYASLLVRLVKAHALSAALLPCVETLAACLAGMGRAKCAALSMLAAAACKLGLQFLLVSDPAFGVLGAAISANVCYLIAFFLDLIYTVKKGKEKAYDNGRKSRNGARGADPEGVESLARGGQGIRAHRTFARGFHA